MPTYSVALLALLAGCFHQSQGYSRYVMTPDGSRGVVITCHDDQADCFDEAQRMCPTGYVVLDQASQSGAVTRTQYNAFLNSATTVQRPTYDGSMLIQCRMPYGYPPPPMAQ